MIISHIVLSQSNIYASFFYYICHSSISSTHYSFVSFFNHAVSPIRLRLHVTQEVPLPPFICNRSCHIEANVDLGWGES